MTLIVKQRVSNTRTIVSSLLYSGAESENNQEEKQTGLPEGSLTPWEVWFVGKEKEERDRLQQKAQEVTLDFTLFI